MTVPRVIACGHFYANPVIPELHHCQTALGRLPVNEDPILYRPLRRSLNDPPNLLVVETHGQYIVTFLLPTAFGNHFLDLRRMRGQARVNSDFTPRVSGQRRMILA